MPAIRQYRLSPRAPGPARARDDYAEDQDSGREPADRALESHNQLARESAVALLGLSVWLTACTPTGSPSPSATTSSPTPSIEEASPSPTQSSQPATLLVDDLAEVLVDDLRLRAAPGLNADSLGVMPAGEPVYVVDGPIAADGYEWYQLASVREPYRGDCGDPAPPPSLECMNWFGWAAAVTPIGDRWLMPLDSPCPAERDTDAYLRLAPAARLACAGSEEWRLTAYMAPLEGGRGCLRAYLTKPAWLDPCAASFPQPEESQVDSSTDLVAFVHPDLGQCQMGLPSPECPFDALKGSWVELVGHLDDPAAATCQSTTGIAEPPFPPPDADWVVFLCRIEFVVTELRAVAGPGG